MPSPRSWHAYVPSLLEIAIPWTWGCLLLKFWIGGQLRLLIHPNYNGLTAGAGIVLLAIAWLKLAQLLAAKRPPPNPQAHLTLLPRQWSLAILLAVALLGFLIPPRALSSSAALQRGIRDTLPLTRHEPEVFRASSDPGDRSLVEWVRTLNAYPEPDAYADEPVRVSGFVIHAPELPAAYVYLARFLVTCCAVDAYPVVLPVRLDTDRSAYPPDTWLTVDGVMAAATLPDAQGERRRAVVVAESVDVIPTPDDPYSFEE